MVDLAEHGGDDAVARTLDAMRAGVNVILQPALRSGRWFGRPDVLRRVETPSGFGAWSYQVIDTKLAKETRGGTVLQLALYSEMLGLVQDAIPETFQVVTPDPDEPPPRSTWRCTSRWSGSGRSSGTRSAGSSTRRPAAAPERSGSRPAASSRG